MPKPVSKEAVKLIEMTDQSVFLTQSTETLQHIGADENVASWRIGCRIQKEKLSIVTQLQYEVCTTFRHFRCRLWARENHLSLLLLKSFNCRLNTTPHLASEHNCVSVTRTDTAPLRTSIGVFELVFSWNILFANSPVWFLQHGPRRHSHSQQTRFVFQSECVCSRLASRFQYQDHLRGEDCGIERPVSWDYDHIFILRVCKGFERWMERCLQTWSLDWKNEWLLDIISQVKETISDFHAN